MNNATMFDEIVGQEAPKKVLGFYVNSYLKTRLMPNLILLGQKGIGKSMIARETAKQLIQFGEDGQPVMKECGKQVKKKKFHEINASTIKSVRGFINGLIVPHVVDKDCTIFIDEAHNLQKDITQSLLTMLNPNETNKNQFVYDDYTCDIDFKRQTFIFATTESHSIFAPLMDRLTRIDLADYTKGDLARIIAKNSPEVDYREGVLEDMATVVRCNARQAVKMSSNVRTYLAGKTVFARKDWSELKSILSIMPLGLSQKEIDLLNFMLQRPDGSSLNNLAFRSGLSPLAIQKDYESYLQHLGLMEISAGKGRQITPRGQEYLKGLVGKK